MIVHLSAQARRRAAAFITACLLALSLTAVDGHDGHRDPSRRR